MSQSKLIWQTYDKLRLKMKLKTNKTFIKGQVQKLKKN
jgi:hypothetical protein